MTQTGGRLSECLGPERLFHKYPPSSNEVYEAKNYNLLIFLVCWCSSSLWSLYLTSFVLRAFSALTLSDLKSGVEVDPS